MRLHPEVRHLYDTYREAVHPHCKNDREVQGWLEATQLNRVDFARLICTLVSHGNIHSALSSIDFEFNHVSLVIRGLAEMGLALWNSDGNLKHVSDSLLVADPRPRELPVLSPDPKYDQDPIDEKSRHAIAQWIARQFPYFDDISIGLIGDDDLLSIALARTGHFRPFVLELDERVSDAIARLADDEALPIKLIRQSVVGFAPNVPLVDTFYSDPPYTVQGTLRFAIAGLLMMHPDELNEFFIRGGRMHFGRRLLELQRLFAAAGAVVVGFQESSASYPFHEGLTADNRRMHELHQSMDIKLPSASRTTLFHYRFRKLDLQALRTGLSDDENLFDYFAPLASTT